MVIDGESELLLVLGDLKSSGGLLSSIRMDEVENSVSKNIFINDEYSERFGSMKTIESRERKEGRARGEVESRVERQIN